MSRKYIKLEIPTIQNVSIEKIVITKAVYESLEGFMKGHHYSKIGVLVDENTLDHCYPYLKDALPDHFLIEIKSGETEKNLKTCEFIWSKMTVQNLDRDALLINIGGGVISDMGGFCASTYKRGIDFLNIPTTLLSQVDASVGGKLGIDFNNYKNHIGLFCEPKLTIIDTVFLQTLPVTELRSGFAEVIKHCLIKDPHYWNEVIKNDFKNQDWYEIVKHSVKLKKQIVDEDPKESGLRKILNFGHTIGHAVESYYLNTPGKILLHGEAIAIGMICEAYLSMQKTHLPKSEMKILESYIVENFKKIALSKSDIEKISKLTSHDKKNKKGVINCTLLKTIGESVYDIPVQSEDIIESLKYYAKNQ